MENANFFEKLMQYAEKQGINNVNELAEALKYRSPEKLYRLKRDPNAKPSYDILTDISNLFDKLNMGWLLTGKGAIEYNTPAQNTSLYPISKPKNEYTPSDRRPYASPTLSKTASPTASPTEYSGLPQVVTVDKKGVDNVVMVPVTARAGYLVGYGDPEFISDLPTYHIPKLYGGTFRAFEVEGHSMVPTITQGDIVFAEWVEKFNDMTDDRVYVVVTKTDGILVKRVLNRVEQYGFLVCKSDAVINRRHYPNINIPPQDILEIWQAKMYLGADFSSPSDIFDRLNDLEAAIEALKQR
jgi:phage repressor protein C with HTH and peptisase S24 domain